MKVFILCCMSLFLLANSASIGNDKDEKTAGLMELFLEMNKKSDTENEVADEKDEDAELHKKMVEDIMSNDVDSLREHIRQLNAGQAFNEHVGVDLESVVLRELNNLFANVVADLAGGSKFQAIRQAFFNTDRNDVICLLSTRNNPRWFRSLKRAFPELQTEAVERCNN